jgi:phage tail-like protein
MLPGTTTPRPSPNGAQAPPERPRSKDAHLGLRFWVEIDGIQVAGFEECTGLMIETEVFEYPQGGLNTGTHKFPVRTKWGNVTLKRGIDVGQDLLAWYLKTMDGKTSMGGKEAEGPRKGDPVRANVSIMLYGPVGSEPVRQWHLRRAFPVKWVGPALKSDKGAVAVETLEFAHEGLVFSSSPTVIGTPDERYK